MKPGKVIFEGMFVLMYENGQYVEMEFSRCPLAFPSRKVAKEYIQKNNVQRHTGEKPKIVKAVLCLVDDDQS